MIAPAAPTLPRRHAVWWLRWLLVLLLVFDQVSAPLHLHHHDNGVDVAGMSQGHPHAEHLSALDLEDDDDDGGQAGHHASGGPRTSANASAQSADGGPDVSIAISDLLAAERFGGLAASPERVWPLALALDTPAKPVPLSRPPDGRAPPART
jgi:hypothetical protein